MELKDLFLTPIYLIIIYSIAYWKRNKYTNKFTRKYFIPALSVKIIGAISLGIIYQFYYGDGRTMGFDTGNYFKHSTLIYKAFNESIIIGWKLIFANGEYDPETVEYSSRMFWYKAPTEYAIVRISAVLAILSFNTYTVISIFFAALSFTGMWAMYSTFLKLYPSSYKELAIAVFFLPSVFFWGSGLMKDSITIGALGWLFYGFHSLFIEKKSLIKSLLITFVAAYIIYSIKVYILLSFLPPALLWIFIENNARIKNKLVRNIAKPIFLILGILVAALGAVTITEGDSKYDIDKIGESTKVTQEYLSEQVQSGSAYNVGELDGTIGSMIKVSPQAIAAALFRPFLWEVRNPVMLLSALEATVLIIFTLRIFYKTGIVKTISLISTTPILTFCFLFSLIFAFGVGLSSGNFGTLVRYKIPLMPFYLSGLYIISRMIRQKKRAAKTISQQRLKRQPIK